MYIVASCQRWRRDLVFINSLTKLLSAKQTKHYARTTHGPWKLQFAAQKARFKQQHDTLSFQITICWQGINQNPEESMAVHISIHV